METQHSWRLRLSFKNTTIVMTVLNIITVFFLLKGFISSPSTRNNKPSIDRFNSGSLLDPLKMNFSTTKFNLDAHGLKECLLGFYWFSATRYMVNAIGNSSFLFQSQQNNL